MPGYLSGIGKGLREPCSPFREAYVFGEELNTPGGGGWNCIPAIVGATTHFDLSTISKNREVVVVLLGISDTGEGSYNFNFKWYRERDNRLVFEGSWSSDLVGAGWVYSASYIGYTDWEISENGDYRVELSVTGAASYQETLHFSVSGISEVIPLPEVPTPFMASIVEVLNNASSFVYSIYLEALGWVFPFWYVAPFFYSLSTAFNNLAWGFYKFSIWVDDVTTKVATIPSSADIFFLLWTWLGYASDAWSWVSNAFSNVWNIIDDWWTSARGTVLAMIDEATQGLSTLRAAWSDFWNITFPEWTGRLDTLRSEWNYFWTVVYPALVDVTWIGEWWRSRFVEVGDLIDSKIKETEPFWQGWQDWRDKVTEFFTDPEDWLYKATDRIIERFW